MQSTAKAAMIGSSMEHMEHFDFLNPFRKEEMPEQMVAEPMGHSL